MDEEAREHEIKMARIKSRQAAFDKAPITFTVWDILHKILTTLFWVCFWALITQCICEDCIW